MQTDIKGHMINFNLMKHQSEALKESFTKDDLFLAFEMGTGKTCTVLQILRKKCSDNERVMRTLILAPLVVLKNWEAEIGKFTNIKNNNVHVLMGTAQKRMRVLEGIGDEGGIVIANYEIMGNKRIFSWLLNWAPEILVCDESHYVKNFKSKRALAVCRLGDNAQHTFMLTGTPILNTAADLFMQFRIMDGNKDGGTFGKNFYSFRHVYFEDRNHQRAGTQGYFPKYVERENARMELKRKIDAKMLKVTKEQCLDLPDLVVQNIQVPLSPEQQLPYNQMKRDFIAFVESSLSNGEPMAVVAKIAITKLLRLQQIVSGFVKTEMGDLVELKNVPRRAVLKDLLETITVDHKVIVWSVFRHNYTMIAKLCDELNVKHTAITGDTKDKAAAAEEFNSDPEIKVLIGNPGAGGVGINLVAASYMIYYSRDFKLSSDLQSESRNHRKGSEIHKKITRINLEALGTVDQLISEALRNKQDISKEVIGWKERL